MPVSVLEAQAGDLMSSPPIVVNQSTSLKEAAKLMIDKKIGCLPVVNENAELAGIVTERTFQVQISGVRPDSALSAERRVWEELYVDGPDRMSQVQEGFIASYSRPVSEVMLTNPPVVKRDTPLWKVAETLLSTHLSHLVVVMDRRPIGVIARHDLLLAYAGR